MLALGIDIGTSGVRTAVLDTDGNVVATARAVHLDDAATNAASWWSAVEVCLSQQMENLRAVGHDPKAIKRIAVDGTSGTMVLVDSDLEPVTLALLYNTAGFAAEAAQIEGHAEQGSITRGSSSALARMLRLQLLDADQRATHLLHQADYVAAKLAGRTCGSDDNNALKLGWDPATQSWPGWFADAGVRVNLLPGVHRVGDAVGTLDPALVERWSLAGDTQIMAGTTDSIAAFLASGASRLGDAVTSLGTTLAIKLLSDTRADDPASGVYSHRLGDLWLAGGASNTGGGVLLSFFNADQLADLSKQIDPAVASSLHYYPLTKPGERFPTNDPDLQPMLEPRPADDAEFLHGLFESIARIEAEGYARLQALGASPLRRLFTAGGGASNPVWSAIRHRHIQVDMVDTDQVEASVGAARIAQGAF